MRKSTTPEDLLNDKIPKLMYCLRTRSIKQWDYEEIPFWAFHHKVKQQKIENNPDLIKFQELIYMPNINQQVKTIDGKTGNPHSEADNFHSRYKSRWGVELSEVIYLD